MGRGAVSHPATAVAVVVIDGADPSVALRRLGHCGGGDSVGGRGRRVEDDVFVVRDEIVLALRRGRERVLRVGDGRRSRRPARPPAEDSDGRRRASAAAVGAPAAVAAVVGPAAVPPPVSVPLQVRRRRRCRGLDVAARRSRLDHVADRDEERGSRRHLLVISLWFQLWLINTFSHMSHVLYLSHCQSLQIRVTSNLH